ncbi:MAG: esterase-like activity of phytase family protein [Ilumatobacter sp.]|uniref:esterase-like activity of phytase family protein n=1 Tax=Ilumatobacter sp. TaxID=1967498 RepID=UPI00260EE3BE|nr:esterase-like activity of phytase family protein [Ilumatobacter sp.]MDJ0767288.1 esterase-like activity of phytase family protein [Ilumatobacter sp.]
MGVPLVSPSSAASGGHHAEARTVVGVEFLGEVVVPTGTLFDGTEIGGLSSITYDRGRDVYYVVSDDQGNRPTGDPVRYYTVELDIDDVSSSRGDDRSDDASSDDDSSDDDSSDGGTPDAGLELEFEDVTQLFDRGKVPFAPGGVDPEGFALARGGQLYLSSEGNSLADPIIDPFVRRYNRRGKVTAELPIPDYYFSNGVDRGVRFNLSFESLNPTPNRRELVTAGEGALFQDGPASTFTNGSLARVLVYDLRGREPVTEYVYEVGPWAEPSTIFGVNGIVEVLPIDDAGTMLVMERSFSVGGILGGGTGNVVVINEISTAGATDVLGVDALYDGGAPIPLTPVSQREVFAFDDLGIPIDNIEGMTFGPQLDDGRHTLVIVSDNNFNAGQFTQFIVLALDIERDR